MNRVQINSIAGEVEMDRRKFPCSFKQKFPAVITSGDPILTADQE